MSKGIFERLFRREKAEEDEQLSQIIKKEERLITEYEKKMIKNIVKLNNITVKEIMVPRVDVVSVECSVSLDEIIKISEERGNSRVPVFDENIENIIGVLHVKDLLGFFYKKEKFNMKKVLRQAFFVPESKQISKLLVDMREKKSHLAIVVDEYGGFSGIVCLEDIIEKIVGEIQDEFDNEVDDIIEIGKNKYLINARISLEELNNRLGTDLDDKEIDTLGGLIYMLFGKIPLKNERVHHKDYIFTIETITGRKMKRIKMEIVDDKNR